MAVKTKTKKTQRRSAAGITKVRKPCDEPIRRTKRSTAEKSEVDRAYEALDLSDPGEDEVDAEDVICVKLNRVMVKRSTYIAKKLAQRAEEGSVTGANLVLQLVRRKKEGKKKLSKRLAAFVDTLESDPDEVKPEMQSVAES